ncbi:LPXTG cell wall anchor domain-containing protein [Staphylococcus epidermidis]|nr:LPXTG cell wall anchor domain-containing protein [Staphylococcus epidermidis]MCT1832502.1 LPXTG cell wall anchor domain-containing protein [Staphylococcus epidermidis]
MSNDPLKANETNPEIQNGNFSQVSGGSLPTSSKRLTVVTNVDNWHSYSTDPNPEYPMFYTTTAVNYPNFMSNGNAPYGVILGRTTDGWNRNVIDSKVAGIYQDIDVVPGSELNVNFISTSPVFSDGAAGAKLKISNVEQNRVLFDSRLNGMGPYPTGKLSAMVNIPNDINRVRISFLPVSSTGRVSVQRSSREHGFGDNSSYYHGGSVSDVRINSGSYVTSKVTQREYTTQPNSSNDAFARATINLSVENKGHNQSKDTYYEVVLPQNSRLISTRGGSGNYNNATNKLSIRLDNLNPGDRKDISYTVDFESLSPKLINLNAHVLYKTNATFRGNDGQRTGDNIVDLQSIALLMNKDVLETELNEIDKFIRDLNEADFTIDSWSALQEKMTEGRNILNEQQNQVALDNQASQKTINNVTQSLEILKNNLKYNTPPQPIIKSNNQIPNITISPAEKADKLTITYQNIDNEKASIIANKLNNQWSLNNNIPGIEIEMQTGLVTIDYKAVYPESIIGANDKTGNSDASAESRITMPRKEATPLSPIVEVNEERVNVTIVPNGEATQIDVKYRTLDGQETTLIASKNESSWTLNKQIDHVNVDENSGKVTIDYQAVQPESEIIATETNGNSDASAESRITMPRKEATPLSPIVEANEERVNVTIVPNGEATQIAIKYRTPDGQEATLIASKNESSWTLNKQIDHVNVDENSGKVTIDYQAVQPESEIIATETNGNSDASAENRVTMPVKEKTPAPPISIVNESNASVEIIPQVKVTRLSLQYIDAKGQQQNLIATLNQNQWTLNKNVSHITLDNNTGKILINYQAVYPESEVIARESKGNSDSSNVSMVIMPRKEATPLSPIVEANEERVNVTIAPNGEATQIAVKYRTPDGQKATLVASKTNQQWTLNKQIDYVNVDENSGKVTMGYQAVQPESEIIATETKGNSDASAESRVIMPRKTATPKPPIIKVDEMNASLAIIPYKNNTAINIHYIDKKGIKSMVTAIKNNDQWQLDEKIKYVKIDAKTGTVIINYQIVQENSEIIATAINGNSDKSEEVKVLMPIKEITPLAPLLETNFKKATVSILPQSNATKLDFKYRDKKGDSKVIIVKRFKDIWKANQQISGVSINPEFGQVVINYQAVYPESDILAAQYVGNSDASEWAKVKMPKKEIAPHSPSLTYDNIKDTILITPNSNATEMELSYVDKNNKSLKVKALKINNRWKFDSSISNISINPNTGKIILQPQFLLTNSKIIVSAKKGNSDASISVSLRVPVVKKIELEPISNVPVPVSLNKKNIQFDDCSGVNNSLNKQISKTQLPNTGYSDKASKWNILSVLLLGFGFLSYSRKRKEKQ